MTAATIHLANFVNALGQPIPGLIPGQQPADQLVSIINDLRGMTNFIEITSQFLKTLEVKVTEACHSRSIQVPQTILDALNSPVVGASPIIDPSTIQVPHRILDAPGSSVVEPSPMVDPSTIQHESPVSQSMSTTSHSSDSPIAPAPITGLHSASLQPDNLAANACLISTQADSFLVPQNMPAFQMNGPPTNGMMFANQMAPNDDLMMPMNEMANYQFYEDFNVPPLFPSFSEDQTQYEHPGASSFGDFQFH